MICEILENIKRFDEFGHVYWSARELSQSLLYKSYQKFEELINKSILSLNISQDEINNHFIKKDFAVNIGNKAIRKIKDYHLSALACRQIVNCASSKKKEVVYARRYFFSKEFEAQYCKNEQVLISNNILGSKKWASIIDEASDIYKYRMKSFYETMINSHNKYLQGWRRDDSFGRSYKSKDHIIYKLGNNLLSKDASLEYEFCIEYNITKPSNGIYYGVRVTILSGDENEQVDRMMKEFQFIKELMAKILSNTFPGKKFSSRFRLTDNIHNSTYWPFWLSLYEEENISEVAARSVYIIKNIYKLEFGLDEKLGGAILEVNSENKTPKHNYEEDPIVTENLFTDDVYDKFLKTLGKGKNIWLEFEKKLLDKEVIFSVPYYEKAFQVDVFSKYKEIIYLFNYFFTHNNIRPIWSLLSKLLLNPKGNVDKKMSNNMSSMDDKSYWYDRSVLLYNQIME